MVGFLIGAVARVGTDAVTLSLTKDEVGAYRWRSFRLAAPARASKTAAVVQQGGRALSNATTRFFEGLEARGHEPRLEKVKASLRFDLTNGKQTNRWHVAIDKGEIAAARQERQG